MKNTYRFTSTIWIYKGDSPWHFVTVDENTSKEIKDNLLFKPKGFGSIPVQAKVGNTSWKTSIFPDKNKTYLLPIKKNIRQDENLVVDQKYSFNVTVLL